MRNNQEETRIDYPSHLKGPETTQGIAREGPLIVIGPKKGIIAAAITILIISIGEMVAAAIIIITLITAVIIIIVIIVMTGMALKIPLLDVTRVIRAAAIGRKTLTLCLKGKGGPGVSQGPGKEGSILIIMTTTIIIATLVKREATAVMMMTTMRMRAAEKENIAADATTDAITANAAGIQKSINAIINTISIEITARDHLIMRRRKRSIRMRRR
mmetsp:Transcript_22492/g.19450  ORF Transcript_22492/g.19450 Transcript_22492/m.19450 type:complete len:215 (+) Transcript_22492:135-779(+)